MKQETVCAIPAELFTVGDSGASSSKGACVCAVVVLPSRPPKYTLVCYNAQQVTFCVARMSWVDEQNTSLRLIVAPSGHVAFTDDTNQRWMAFFAEAVQLTRFIACVGVAFYSLYGAPVTSVFYQDVSLPSSSLRLEAGDKAAVRFVGFELLEKDGICSVGAMAKQLQQHQRGGGEADAPPYVFQPRSSAVQLGQGCFGFEGSVLGMREDDRRVLIVPAGYTTRVSDSLTGVAAQGVVYVVQLLRVEHVREGEQGSGSDATRQDDKESASAHTASAAAPPPVYAATAEAETASNTRALALVNPPAAAGALQPPSNTAPVISTSTVPSFLSSTGIPPEHMSVLRKVELGINAAVTGTRDVHDVAAIFSQEWRQYVERPKPSLLSNKALLEQVQRVVSEEETAQAHLDDCDRLIQALDARNKELQQRIDRATVESQKLLQEKNNASAKAMDARLEKDRQLVRLKDALLLRRQEQEDLQRHVTALQRTVDVSNEELRLVQGKRDIHQVEVNSIAERLAAMQETLSEERHRNAALTAKKASTEESLKKAQVQQRLAEGQLTTARGLAEKERLRYVQIMEEERHHRAQDSELLRQDILHELDARERQYQVDRHRIAEEQFTRGLRDGKAEGRQAAETDLLGHQDELRLNLQRAKTEVETTKEEVRRSIESAMALRRTLGGKVSEMEEQLAHATRKQTQLQYQVAQWQTRCRTVRDTVGQHWRTLITHATHPCTREELLAMMKAVRVAEEKSFADDVEAEDALVRVDLQFQSSLWQQSRNKSIEQRLRWIAEEMTEMYVKGAEYHFHHEWQQPVEEAHDATLQAVAQVYAALHGSRNLFDLCVQEAQERHAQQQQWWRTINEIETWLVGLRSAQDSVKAAEAEARRALWKAYIDGGDSVVQLCAAHLRAQILLLQEEMQGRDEVAAEEGKQRARLPADGQELWLADCSAALHLLEEAEEAARAGLEAEAYTATSGIKFQFAYAQRGAEEAELQRVLLQEMHNLESEARQGVVREAAQAWEAMVGEAAAALAPLPTLIAWEEEAPRSPPPLSTAAMVASESPSSHGPDVAAQRKAAEAEKVHPASFPSSTTPPTSSPSMPEKPVSALGGQTGLPPSPHSPAVPAFTLTDPPRVHRNPPAHPTLKADAYRSNGNDNAAVDNAEAVQDNLVFSDEPPPLPLSDSDEVADNTSVENGTAAPLPLPSSPPPLPIEAAGISQPRVRSAKKQLAAPFMDREAPPPLPSDDDDVEESSEPSSSSASPTPAFSPTAKTRIPPPPVTLSARRDLAHGTAALETAPAPVTSKMPKEMFGRSSSEEEEDEDEEDHDAVDRERPSSASHSPPTSAQRGNPGKARPSSSSAARASAKPKLFDSSDDD